MYKPRFLLFCLQRNQVSFYHNRFCQFGFFQLMDNAHYYNSKQTRFTIMSKTNTAVLFITLQEKTRTDRVSAVRIVARKRSPENNAVTVKLEIEEIIKINKIY